MSNQKATDYDNFLSNLAQIVTDLDVNPFILFNILKDNKSIIEKSDAKKLCYLAASLNRKDLTDIFLQLFDTIDSTSEYGHSCSSVYLLLGNFQAVTTFCEFGFNPWLATEFTLLNNQSFNGGLLCQFVDLSVRYNLPVKCKDQLKRHVTNIADIEPDSFLLAKEALNLKELSNNYSDNEIKTLCLYLSMLCLTLSQASSIMPKLIT